MAPFDPDKNDNGRLTLAPAPEPAPIQAFYFTVRPDLYELDPATEPFAEELEMREQQDRENIVNAVFNAIEADGGAESGEAAIARFRREWNRIGARIITYPDALGILLQSYDDYIEAGRETSDAMVESAEEGVDNHWLYHRGRPGECGVDCPAYAKAIVSGDGVVIRHRNDPNEGEIAAGDDTDD